MDVSENVGDRDRLARAALAVVLTIAAIRSFRNGKRMRGLLAGAGALVFGFNASTKYCGVNDALDIDTSVGVAEDESDDDTAVVSTADETTESATESAPSGASLTCAACGDPIVVGESRSPNEDGETVHDACK
ncbi:YgaP family membrane protein [Haloarcula pellucida]|uniref:Inner membrane protein YgaP-like transmembrane domain-containing protein n=1 Tax=Haloarcula pellucida TaxID=1427151 RepID=A0A830GPE1_9EURY|nr:DUF2892 domain-containing protein [Halomicroarcula pellucida]MBX0348303.1 DUF2892 domain-containing protein [Halomicroarcula pellucida]GGN97919.1 hypothetical protein GCM10009030_27720 [Halomicroarcula pellucida]